MEMTIMWARKPIWIAAVVVVLVAAFVGYRYRQARAKKDIQFETTKVDRGRIVAKVTASGTLSAIVTVQVGSQVSGSLQKILVDFNSPVHKGQLIATLDPQLFQAAYEQATANYAAAKGNLAKAEFQAIDAERQSKRSQSLASRKLIAQADVDTAQATADAARAQVDASKGAVGQSLAALHQAEVNLAYTSIHSPTDGVVISRNVDVGQTVAASLQAPTLFVIAEDLRKMQVDTWVAEADIGRLKSGMASTFTVDAYPGERFRGTVRQIRNAPQTLQNVVTYDAVIDIDNSSLKLKPGMTANVTFVVAERDSVLRVPNAALRFRPNPGVLALAGLTARGAGAGRGSVANADPGGFGAGRPNGGRSGGASQGGDLDRHSIWLLTGTKPHPLSLRLGVSDGSLTEVLEGDLAEGDLVITDANGGETGGAQGTPGGIPRRLF
jgi:HlyD family secretion protein